MHVQAHVWLYTTLAPLICTYAPWDDETKHSYMEPMQMQAPGFF
jgi:hypothetical protein